MGMCLNNYFFSKRQEFLNSYIGKENAVKFFDQQLCKCAVQCSPVKFQDFTEMCKLLSKQPKYGPEYQIEVILNERVGVFEVRGEPGRLTTAEILGPDRNHHIVLKCSDYSWLKYHETVISSRIPFAIKTKFFGLAMYRTLACDPRVNGNCHFRYIGKWLEEGRKWETLYTMPVVELTYGSVSNAHDANLPVSRVSGEVVKRRRCPQSVNFPSRIEIENEIPFKAGLYILSKSQKKCNEKQLIEQQEREPLGKMSIAAKIKQMLMKYIKIVFLVELFLLVLFSQVFTWNLIFKN